MAALLAGIVLGVESNLPYGFNQQLRRTGIIHVVVASGSNVIFVAGVVGYILESFLSRRYTLLIAFPIIWIYTALAGGGAPIVRAAIMISLTLAAGFWGRQKDTIRALVLAAVIMAFYQPRVIFDLGFQLSFAATAGIILFKDNFDHLIRWVPGRKLIGDDLATTLSAQVLTTPLLMSAFGQFLPLSFIPNALLLWLVPEAMILGAILAVLGAIFLPLAYVWAWATWVPLWIFTAGVEFFSRFSLVWKFSFPGWLIWGYYAVVGILWFLIERLAKGEETKNERK